MTSRADAAGLGCAVVYAVGTPGRPETQVPALRAHIDVEGWSLVDVCFDTDNTSHPADRPGLRLTLDRLQLGFAAALVLDSEIYGAMPGSSWLDAAVRTCDGSLRRVTRATSEHAITNGCANVGGDARLVACPFPTGLDVREAV